MDGPGTVDDLKHKVRDLGMSSGLGRLGQLGDAVGGAAKQAYATGKQKVGELARKASALAGSASTAPASSAKKRTTDIHLPAVSRTRKPVARAYAKGRSFSKGR